MKQNTYNGAYVTVRIHKHNNRMGHVVEQLVEALRYKSEGRGFDSRLFRRNFSLT